MKILATLSLLFSALFVFAQHDKASNGTTNATQHLKDNRKQTVYIHNLPRPKLMAGIGSSTLKIETKSDSAQKYFNQGVALTHCFWDFEAYRSFKEATRLDSTAVMAWWGLASTVQSMYDEAFKADKELSFKKLKSLKATANAHEKLYVEGLLLIDSLKEGGDKAYMKKLETIVHKFPDDLEAQLFLALSNMAGYEKDGSPLNGQIYSERLLSDILAKHPDNAAANHYWIHAMEAATPEKAIKSADALSAQAPASGHMVHMPGHIYNRVGDYKKAFDSFTASVKVDSAYMNVNGIQEVDTWNYIHNIHYLLANCAQDGRYTTALFYAEKLSTMKGDKSRKGIFKGNFFQQGILAPARMELCFGFYDKAAKRLQAILDVDTLYGANNMAYKEALTFFALGMDAVEKKQLQNASKYADALDAYLYRNSKQGNKENAINSYAMTQLNIFSLELQGCIKSLENKNDEAIEVLSDANKRELELGYGEPPSYPRPVIISLSNLYAKTGKYDKAIAGLEELLKIHPNGAPALHSLYKIYKQKGDEPKAKEYADRLKKTLEFGDKNIYKL